ncbi:anti-sigma F factor [Desulfurispora thermophila]|uniref:anti-sigma F factor n=1 Tax=Desulfurispora thermophila TaxID=265470 RepID=UPI003F6444DE
MSMEFSSQPANVAFARVAVAAFASQLDFTLAELDELKVAVSEAVANAIVHGYAGSQLGTVRIETELYYDRIVVMIEDHGCGIADIKKALQPAYTTDPERMGLGFTFMQSFADSLKVNSKPGQGTRIVMSKRLSRAIPAIAGH